MKARDIEHSGILGMKWGIRRYQNKDGTYTEAGKKRYSKTNVSEMSDIELKSKINRLQQEKQYKDLTKPEYKKVASKVGQAIIVAAVLEVGKSIATKNLNKAVNVIASSDLVKKGTKFVANNIDKIVRR